MEAVNHAWAHLVSLDPGKRYFAKILYTKDETAALSRNNFSLLAAPAITPAQVETPSMQFYRGGNTAGTSGELVTAVMRYLNLHMNSSQYSIGLSPLRSSSM
jgi:hypothetical protein